MKEYIMEFNESFYNISYNDDIVCFDEEGANE